MDLFCSFIRVNLFAHKASKLQDFLFSVFSPFRFNYINLRAYQVDMSATTRILVEVLCFDFADNGFVTVAKENDASDLQPLTRHDKK